jgi:hypothetical protein
MRECLPRSRWASDLASQPSYLFLNLIAQVLKAD